MSVQYTGRLEDGTIFDSSRPEDAKQSKNYNAERQYEPLKFTVGAGQMIPGFDAGVVGMKKGEKKTLTLAPKDAYGEATREETYPLTNFQDVITQDVPVESFKDVITQDVPVSLLGERAASLKVGDELNIGQTVAKVTALGKDTVTLQMDNTVNPFYKKALKVGLTSQQDGNTFTIKKIGDKAITVEILNKQNPFFGKKLKAGLVSKLPNGEEISVKSIEGDKITISSPNTHELAGKTLIFDVEIVAIEKAKK